MIYYNKEITPIWILAVPRCGSSYLVNFLNKTNLFYPKFREFNLDSDTKEEIMKNIPKFIKFQRIFFDIKNFNDFEDKKKILIKYPKIKFIYLQRKDIFEQTISNFFAEQTGVWGINNQKKLQDYNKKKIPFLEDEIIRLFKRNLSYLNCWDNFIRETNYIKCYYENFLKDKHLYLKNILKFLNISVDIKKTINNCDSIKISRPESKEYCDRLKKIIEG